MPGNSLNQFQGPLAIFITIYSTFLAPCILWKKMLRFDEARSHIVRWIWPSFSVTHSIKSNQERGITFKRQWKKATAHVLVPEWRRRQVAQGCTEMEGLCEALTACRRFVAGEASTHIPCHWSCGRAHAKRERWCNSCSVVRLSKTQTKRKQSPWHEASLSRSLCF